MPIVRAERSVPGALLIVLVLLLSACAGTGTNSSEVPPTPGASEPPPRSGSPGSPGSTSGPGPLIPTPNLAGAAPIVDGLPVPRDLDVAFTALLERRAAALLARDRDAFLAVLDQGDVGFLTAQQGYFDNLVQLPLADFSYAVDPSSLVRGTRSYSVVVEITMQLEGFDALPSRTLDRFRFDQQGRPGRRSYLLSSVTDAAWEETNDIQSQPWESRPIQVRSRAGVLAVFDDTSVLAARPLMRDLERSLTDVAARVPYPWAGTVVVYALSDTTFIRSLDGLPGDQPDALDAIAFTVPAGPGDTRTAATRVALNPRIVTRSGLARERLLRHELTHVAVAERDDNAPLWLSEGLAEWVSVQALPERKQRIGTEALRAARRGVEEMPADATFNDDDSSLHYAVSWWASEYLEATYGPTAPWAVLDAFAAPGTPEEATIEALLEISLDRLAKRATALLVKTYAPAPRRPVEIPSDTAGEG